MGKDTTFSSKEKSTKMPQTQVQTVCKRNTTTPTDSGRSQFPTLNNGQVIQTKTRQIKARNNCHYK